MDTSTVDTDLADALQSFEMRGNLFYAGRLRDYAKIYRTKLVPFLVRAIHEGSVPIRAAAIEELAKLDLDAAGQLALSILTTPEEDSDVRASAAEALSQVHSGAALEALLQATCDRPMVASSALRALEGHHDESANKRIYEHLQFLVEKLRSQDVAVDSLDDQKRRVRAVLGLDGESGLFHLLVQRRYAAMENDLPSWWRAHPLSNIQAAAAYQLIAKSVDNACDVLSEGLPSNNEGHPSGTGELDNGEVRGILVAAAMVVLRGDPSEAFHRLAHYFNDDQIVGWFGSKRAELILELLLFQTDWPSLSTWLSLYGAELKRLGARPDRRWADLCSRRKSNSRSLGGLAAALGVWISKDR